MSAGGKGRDKQHQPPASAQKVGGALLLPEKPWERHRKTQWDVTKRVQDSSEMAWGIVIPCTRLVPAFNLGPAHHRQTQGEPRSPAHAPTHQPPLNHVGGELMGCACQQRPYRRVVAGIEPCGAVGAGGAVGSRGVTVGRSLREGADATPGGLEALPQDQQQAQGQHHLRAPLAQHPHTICSEMSQGPVAAAPLDPFPPILPAQPPGTSLGCSPVLQGT